MEFDCAYCGESRICLLNAITAKISSVQPTDFQKNTDVSSSIRYEQRDLVRRANAR